MRSKRERVLDYKRKKLERLIEKLRRSVVVVEGKRDKEALQMLGVGKVVTIWGSADDFARKISERYTEVLLLTDFDRRGCEMCVRLKEALVGYGVKADTTTRRDMKYILGLNFFEDILHSLEEFQSRFGPLNI
ncbi:MAG: toprim domain-containing protein [Candidatus Micrarchaeia archaeon]